MDVHPYWGGGRRFPSMDGPKVEMSLRVWMLFLGSPNPSPAPAQGSAGGTRGNNRGKSIHIGVVFADFQVWMTIHIGGVIADFQVWMQVWMPIHQYGCLSTPVYK